MMSTIGRVARFLAIVCIVGMLLDVYVLDYEPFAFWLMLGLLVCFCICIPIVVLDSISTTTGWRKTND